MTFTSNRFVNNYVSELQQDNWNPISGYKDRRVMSLEEAVESIVPFVHDVRQYAKKAKKECTKNTQLTVNESAAIYLYTMTTNFFEKCNEALRDENPPALEPWFNFLKLYTTALAKLPSRSATVWRGISNITGSNFVENYVYTWWSVTSCSLDAAVATLFTCEKGTLFCITTIYGKDISAYSSVKNLEKEVVLMPGTRLRVKSKTFDVNGFFVVHLEECTAIPEGKHIMLSYHKNSQDIVSKIYQILRDEHIPVWLDENRDTINIRNSLADGVENAAVVCCFITPHYEKCENCKCKLQYAQKRHKQIIPCLLSDRQAWKPTDWLGRITKGLKYIEFRDISESNIRSTVRDLIYRIEEQSSALLYETSKTADKPSYLFDLIRYEYQRNSRIERIMNPSKSFPIEQSYINLAIVNAKEQQQKEKKLSDAQHISAVMNTFEDIYGEKTPIDIKDIFETCKNPEKQVLVFGRAGIGKSTFCRYVAYQWATGSYWSQYELLVLIPLRRLTANHYPPLPLGQSYSLIDFVKNELFRCDLSEEDEILLKKQFDAKKTLWILDGYDEIVQNVPSHLERLFEQLLRTPHHIIASRPYLNTLSYDVQMEITGFTDENIKEYVQQFFNQGKDELDDVSIKTEKLLSFLKLNSSIWGIAHIPVNLELICSLWSNEDWSQTEQLTMTTLYSTIIEWLCRRYLTAQNNRIQQLSQDGIYQCCQKELSFLESLAFYAMESNIIIIRPSLLKKALAEANISSQEGSHMLNIGILKSFNKQGTGNQIEMSKDHYFVHLSFQEYFAARYLVNALERPPTEKAIEFIKYQKYNQRYTLVFTFAAGLLSNSNSTSCLNVFWNNILGGPVDLVGLRHMELAISCLEQTSKKATFPRRRDLFEWIAECIKHNFHNKTENISQHLSQSLQRAQSVVCEQTIIDVFTDLLQHNDQATVLSFLSQFEISDPPTLFITLVTTRLNEESEIVRANVCKVLGNMSGKAATEEVISKLVSTLGDESDYVRRSACKALGKMGEKAATNEVISKIVSTLGDKDRYVRRNACEVLGNMGEKAATNEVIGKLASTLGDESDYVRESACKVLGKMGEKVSTNEMINKLVNVLRDNSDCGRNYACEALVKMGEKAATNEVISKLVSVLGDNSEYAKRSACEVLGMMGEKAATNEVISKLVRTLGDKNDHVRSCACKAVGEMGEKAATNEVISKLVSVLGDESKYVRRSACQVLGMMGEKAATNEVISMLVCTLGDKNEHVRSCACKALGDMGEKAATNEVIGKLVSTLGDQSYYVRVSACEVLGMMGGKAATNEVISKLVRTLGDNNDHVRSCACEALVKIGEKAATNEIISKLASVLEDESNYVRRNACQVLGMMREKAATEEVISKLVSTLGDESDYVRESACQVLGMMSEKAATNEVISKLMRTLGDESYYVRASACKVLGMMGEKAATNEVISKLVNALRDWSDYGRRSACEALVKIGEKAATNEIISNLVSVLGDESEYVRSSACQVLEMMGEKAATNEVISKLVRTLGDKNDHVRSCACKALVKIGEKAATNEIISKLVSVLGDESEYVRSSACQVLGMMVEKAATNEVITRLVNVLRDESSYGRGCACGVLGKVGEKARWSEVISKVVSVLGDNSEYARRSACEVLGMMGEKAATNEVIRKLVDTLGDRNYNVTSSACKALVKIGEKGATNEIISKLVSVLGDESEYVRSSACQVLGMMGEKAATNEVISKLVGTLGDKHYDVRSSACKAVGRMGKEAATNEMISKLVSVLGDESNYVRRSACDALVKMGEKAATNEVISRLVQVINDRNGLLRENARTAVEKILISPAAIAQLDPEIKSDLCLRKYAFDCVRYFSADQLIEDFVTSKNSDLLSTVAQFTLRKGAAVIVIEDKIMVYDMKEPIELFVTSSQLRDQLIQAFSDQAQRLHLYFEVPSDP